MTETAEPEPIERLRAGDEAAFVEIVDRYGASMLRVARRYVKDDGAAEEVVQETWLAVLRGIGRFEGRASFRSWLYAILIKRAMTRGKRDARAVPFSSLASAELARDEPAVAPERFAGPGEAWPRHWRESPAPWAELPEQRLLSREVRAVVEATLATLPPAQRSVVALRDLAGQDAESVAAALEISAGNVRVLLHRGRSKLRGALEAYFTDDARHASTRGAAGAAAGSSTRRDGRADDGETRWSTITAGWTRATARTTSIARTWSRSLRRIWRATWRPTSAVASSGICAPATAARRT